jgi:hypothetical protein
MTGDQHYRKAESLLRIVELSENAPNTCAQLLAEAQVHATLAYAAAKATGLNLPGYGSERGAR